MGESAPPRWRAGLALFLPLPRLHSDFVRPPERVVVLEGAVLGRLWSTSCRRIKHGPSACCDGFQGQAWAALGGCAGPGVFEGHHRNSQLAQNRGLTRVHLARSWRHPVPSQPVEALLFGC